MNYIIIALVRILIIVKCVAYIERLCINIIKKNSERKQKLCKVRWANSGSITIVINAINSFKVHPNSAREINPEFPQ